MKAKAKTPRYTPTAPSIQRHFNGVDFPETWARHHLVDLIDKAAPICYGILMPGEHVPDGIPVIKVRDYVRGPIQIDSVLRTSPEIDKQYRRSRVRTGDILMSIRGGTGDLTVVPESLDGANITQDSARLRVDGGADPDYLLWALRGSFVQSQIALDTIGQAVTGINIGSVRKLVIPIPTPPEQRKIADILAFWDEALEKLDALITAKNRQKQALMRQLLIGKKRVIGATGSWKKVRMGEVLERVFRPIEWHADLPLNLVSLRRRCGGLFRRAVVKGSEYKTQDLHEIRAGDFLISKRQVVHGAWGYVAPEFEGGHVSKEYAILDNRSPESLHMPFFAWLAQTSRLIHLARISSTGVHIEKLIFDPCVFLREFIHIPCDIAEQQRIATILGTCDAELTLLLRQRDALDLQKRGLMQRLLTGKIRVIPRN